MSPDPVFNSTENQALLVVCARKTIRHAAILGIVWGAINLVIGFLAIQATVLNAGILVLGLLMLGAGVTTLNKPSIHSLLSEAVVSVLLLCWNIGIAVFNARSGYGDQRHAKYFQHRAADQGHHQRAETGVATIILCGDAACRIHRALSS